MLIYSIVYDKKNDNIIEELKQIKKLLDMKGINLGYSECVDESNHHMKIYYSNQSRFHSHTKNSYFFHQLLQNQVKSFYKK